MTWNVWNVTAGHFALDKDCVTSAAAHAELASIRRGSPDEYEVRFCGLPWRPIHELSDKYESNLLLLAPELVDLDCNPDGIGMGYWQDDGLLWNASQDECDARDPEKDYGSWMACKWSMTSDEWSHVCCNPTHFLRLTGVSASTMGERT